LPVGVGQSPIEIGREVVESAHPDVLVPRSEVPRLALTMSSLPCLPGGTQIL